MCGSKVGVKKETIVFQQSPVPSSLVPLPLPPFPWDDDSYYHPVLEQDPLLQVDWETTQPTTSPSHNPTSEDGQLSCAERYRDHIPLVSTSSVPHRLCVSERKGDEYKAALVQALGDLQKMK